MLKAYFPNLIAKKESSLVSPINISNTSYRAPIKQHSSSAKDARTKKHFNSNNSNGPRFIDANLVVPGDFVNMQNTQPVQSEPSSSLIIIDDYNRQRLSQEQSLHLPLRKQRS